MSFLNIIKQNRANFLKFNQSKFLRFQQLIVNNNIKKVINSLPLLLCVNHKRLPGYIEGEVPLGIHNFEASEETMKFIEAKFHVKGLKYKIKKPFIEMMAIMGSIGTIAYNKKSDFDYWLCINKQSIEPEKLKNFGKKVDEIQKWATKEIKIEVHLFINDINSIKNNIFAEDEDEAFGSTAGAVLKDEFFRSSILIAGKIPFWWVIPKFVRDDEYEKLIKKIPEEWSKKYFIDLGNLFEISREDFLGAALFQIIKSLGNPFKSIIKIGVLEKYLFGKKGSPLLCQKVKANLGAEKLDNKILDSYILMFEEVYNYYEKVITDKNLLTILRKNLYLKINPKLSKYYGIQNTKKLPYNVIVMFKYVKSWKWTKKDINELDNFENWDYNKIILFWNQVKKFMLMSYQNISTQFPKMDISDKISDSDFKLLSRKIKSHFSQDKNKIDQYITFKEAPYESVIYIEPLNAGIKEVEWRLFKRDTSSGDKFNTTTLKTEQSLVKLLAWTSINQIFHTSSSRVKIKSGYSRINQKLVTDLLIKIAQLFSKKELKLRNQYFLNPSFSLINMIIINFNIENASTFQKVHYIFKTSWGESYIYRYESEKDLLQILKNVLISGIITNKNFEDFCEIISPEPFKKHYKEYELLFRNAYSFIVKKNSGIYKRFAIKLANEYFSISYYKRSIKISSFDNYYKFLATMSLLPKKSIKQVFHGEDRRLQILNQIMESQRKNTLSIYLEEDMENMILYLLNEKGNIFAYIHPKEIHDDFLIIMYDFCNKVIKEINSFSSIPDINEVVRINKIDVNRQGKIQILDISSMVRGNYLNKLPTLRPLSIVIQKNEEKISNYQIKFPDKKKTKFIFFNQIKNILITKSTMDKNFLNMIGEINLIKPDQEDLAFGSSLYFLNKYRIELMINKI